MHKKAQEHLEKATGAYIFETALLYALVGIGYAFLVIAKAINNVAVQIHYHK